MRRPVLLILYAECFGIAAAYYMKFNFRQLLLLAAAAFLCLLVFYKAQKGGDSGAFAREGGGSVRVTVSPNGPAAGCAAVDGAQGSIAAVRKGERNAAVALALIAAAAGMLHTAYLSEKEYASDLYEDEICSFEGRVIRCDVKQYYTALTVDIGHEKILVRISDEGSWYDLVGFRCSFCGEIVKPDARRNPGCFDYALYLKGRNIGSIAKVNKYRITKLKLEDPLLLFLSKMKSRFYEKAGAFMDERSFSLLTALMFADKGYMDDEDYEEFKRLGTAHVLAVSGLHVNLVYSFVVRLFGRKKTLPSSAAAMLLIFCYAALSGFSVSVMRAVVMILLKESAFFLQRRYDTVCAASTCALIFLNLNPYYLFDSGFQLSYTAAYAVGICVPRVDALCTKIADRFHSERAGDIAQKVIPPVVIQLAMMPLVMFHFNNISIISLFINPIVIFLAGLTLPAGLIYFLVPMLVPGIFANSLCRALLIVSDVGYGLGIGYRDCVSPPVGIMFLFYTLFFFFFSDTRYMLYRRSGFLCITVFLFACVFFSSILPFVFGISESPLPWRYPQHVVTFVDVGQGDCTHVSIGGKNILIDGGGNYYTDVAEKYLKPYLLKNGIDHIDIAIITHDDIDHAKGIRQLSEIFDVREIYEDVNEIRIASDASITKLSPIRDMKDKNANSLVLMLSVGELDVLLSADANFAAEEEMLRHADISLCADILKVGHHGSDTSTAESFVDAVSPAFAAISCGRNNSYGHPSARVIELLEKKGIMYARTDLCGAFYVSKIADGCAYISNARRDFFCRIPIK